MAKLHLLSSINEDTRTALCTHCGLVPIRARSGRDKDPWRCSANRGPSRPKRTTPRVTYARDPLRHTITNVVERTGTCSVCGPGVRVRPNRDRWRCYTGYAEKKNLAERKARLAERKAKTTALRATIALSRRSLEVSAPSNLASQMRLLLAEFEDRARALEMSR